MRDDSSLKEGQERVRNTELVFGKTWCAFAKSFQKTVYLELNKGLLILFFLERKCQGFFGDCWLEIWFLTCSWSVVVLLFEIGQVILAQQFCDLSLVIQLVMKG